MRPMPGRSAASSWPAATRANRKELQQHLRRLQLNSTGNKKELIARIEGHEAGYPQIKRGCSVSREFQHTPGTDAEERAETHKPGKPQVTEIEGDLDSRVQRLEMRVAELERALERVGRAALG